MKTNQEKDAIIWTFVPMLNLHSLCLLRDCMITLPAAKSPGPIPCGARAYCGYYVITACP